MADTIVTENPEKTTLCDTKFFHFQASGNAQTDEDELLEMQNMVILHISENKIFET